MLPRRSLPALALALPFLSAPRAAPAAVDIIPPRPDGGRRRRTQDPDVVMPEPGRRAWAAQVPQIRIGLLGGENEADRLARFEPYRQLVERIFQVPARLFPATDYAGVMQGLSARQLEVAGMGPSAYAGAWLDTQGGIEPMTISQQADGSIAYVAVMVVRRDSGITSLEQMRGRSLAWADPNSASGYLIPRFQLRRQGIGVEPGQFFGRTGFAGGHEQAVVAVLQRQYDATVTWASGIGDPNQGYTRGNLRSMVEKGMLDMRDLAIIWTSEPIMNGPLAVRTDLPIEFRRDFQMFQLALAKTEPQIARQIARGETLGAVEGFHEDYALFVEMRREEAAARRRRS
ncbi:MAG: phosphate/phosphite/phosphonate ABC transporter substrate-binding protein [Rhodovarius sp.]|nr:phosphate/phosphite/phosphonate ABC transporter substrate-binding protein [Rhodovarius sp.]MCX7933335.1 phosphate/phosphite/phosphonate ABC transporter substrate-binding protein [Rhodovarius sp.]MDW8314509.1 phosphate/phosphite/phosphonate ABC transporter substrate-binding protein [Rhodovarius sp.]